MSVADGGSVSGAAWAGFGAPGSPGGLSAIIGTTFLASGAEVSGGARGGVAISLGRGVLALADLALDLAP